VLVAQDLVRRHDGFVLGPISVQLTQGLTAVVGTTGAGKTTLARLLAGLDEPTEGTVSVAGTQPQGVRQAGGLVMLPQQPQLLPGTLTDNLALMIDGPTSDLELATFVEDCGLGPWLARFEHGLDTVVDERLSEGDRQVLSMLQVLMRNPAVVVLDEPTASLDPATSATVEATASRLYKGRTLLIITHNMATARRTDRILVLADGQLVGDGRHDDLLACCLQYRRLCGLDNEPVLPQG
jgi:ATP-binding cassette subfamily B protein